jgi:hypothetical protein
MDKTLMDVLTSEDIFIGNGTFPISIEVAELVPLLPEGTEKYTLIEQFGTFEENEDFPTNGVITAVFGCPESEQYSFRVGVEFNQAGDYLVYINRTLPFPLIFFTSADNCAVVTRGKVDAGTLHFTLDVDDTNLAGFEQYLVDNEQYFIDNGIDIEAQANEVRTLLENKEAFYVRVNP